MKVDDYVKKKVLLTIFTVISLFLINIGMVKAETISNDNANSNQGGVVGGDCKGNPATGWCGNEMQGIQVRIYDSNNNLKYGPTYFKFKDGTVGSTFCTLKESANAKYDFDTLNAAKNYYTCSQIDISSSVKILSGYDKAVWGKFFSNANDFNSFLIQGNYAKFKEILNVMGYKYDYATSDNDYVIIEPLVTVRINHKYYTGTITALMATNKEFRSGSWNYINIFSLIGQTFKVKDENNVPLCYDTSNSEYKTPTDANFKVHRISFTSNYNKCGYNKFNIKDVFIEDTCDSSANTKSPAARIQVYEKKYPEDNKLLNFDLDAKTACSSSKNSNISASCLKADLATGTTFNEKDLSNYNFKVPMPSGNKNAYCLATYSLTPAINTPNFGDTKAGMAFIGGTASPEVIATGRLNLVCYLYNITNGDENVDVFQSLGYDSFVSSASFAGQNLVSGNTTSTRTAHTSGTYNNEKYIKYEKTITRTYLTAGVNVEIGSGRIIDDATDSTRVLYGYYSKLGEKKGKHNINFGITLNNGTIVNTEKLSYSNDSACYYNISNELIDYKFRTIDTSNPFIGKNGRNNKGKGRTVGANWCYEVNGTFDCSSDNALVQSVIINTNNSYNKLNQKPKYKFVLTPSTINKIREYNSTHDVYDLDKYELVCDVNTNKCKSGFFRTISDSITEGKTLLVP